MRDLGISKAAVIGLGVTGTAIARVLAEQDIEVIASDAADSASQREAARELEDVGVKVMLGGHDLGVIAWADVIAPAKAVPPSNEVLKAARSKGVPIWGDFEIAYRLGAEDLLAVTGTNGKTTTTELLYHVMQHSGFRAIAAGNLPTPLVAALGEDPEEVTFVCEASSQGLTFIDKFRPRAAVILNIADDHYDYHADHKDYVAVKARITENQTEDDLLVFNAADPACREIAKGTRASLGAFAPMPISSIDDLTEGLGRAITWRAGLERGELRILYGDRLVLARSTSDIRLKGPHNIENVLGAATAALFRGAAEQDVARSLGTFEGLPHRMTVVREIDGVTYVDDSKATNPHATLRALDGLDKAVLIAGGQAKGLDLGILEPSASRLEGLVVMGEAADELETIFSGSGVRIVRAADVEEAARLASRMASTGSTVLLSPACASYDQYQGYAERGERFSEEVMSW